MTERDSRSKQADEPSVEDILASIRRIVFETDGGGAVPDSDVPEPNIPAVEFPAAGRAAANPAVQPAETGAPSGEPPHDGETAAGEGCGPADPDAAEEGPLPEPPAPDIPEATAGPAAGDTVDSDRGPEADPADTVLLLTEMIAPDGSLVRLDLPPAETSLPERPQAPGTAAGGGEGAGEGALGPAPRDGIEATVREWLDRNAPGMVDRAARRELQRLAGRHE